MKIGWNKRTNLPSLEFEESDLNNAYHVKQMLEGKFRCEQCQRENENYAWKILQGYFESLRLRILEQGKAHARGRATKDLCSNDFSVLDGFDLAINTPQRLVLQADLLRPNPKQDMEEQDDGIDYATE